VGDYNDPQTFLGMFMSDDGNNRTGWKNAGYDALINEANAQVNLKKREELFQRQKPCWCMTRCPLFPCSSTSVFNISIPIKFRGFTRTFSTTTHWNT